MTWQADEFRKIRGIKEPEGDYLTEKKRCPVHGCEFITVFKSICTDLGGLLNCPECNREFRALIDETKRNSEEKGGK